MLSRFRNGEEDAATAIYLRYAKRLQLLARSQSGRDLAVRVDPEDVVQSVFRTFFRRAAEGHYVIPDGDELWKLFLVIALNKVRELGEFHRAAKRDVGQTTAWERMEDHVGNPEKLGDQAFAVLRLTVDELLDELPESQRHMVVMRIEGHGVEQISQTTKRAKRSVERVLQKFRGRLSETLSEDSRVSPLRGHCCDSLRRLEKHRARGNPRPYAAGKTTSLMNGRGQQLDDFVEAYEVAREAGQARDLADFVPPAEHPQRRATIVELVRVDLEYSWRDGPGKRVEQYQRMFPEDLSDAGDLKDIAFEEYRLRRWAGEDVSRDIYGQLYAIATDDWPEFPVGNAASSETGREWTDSGLHELSRVDAPLAERLAAATRLMPQVGDRFEAFDLVGELGRGAFGRVYLARQNDLARRFVAVKVTPHVSHEPQRLAQLQHTNIVPIYSVHSHGQLHAICMPFLGPNTLADVIQTLELSGSLPPRAERLSARWPSGRCRR